MMQVSACHTHTPTPPPHTHTDTHTDTHTQTHTQTHNSPPNHLEAAQRHVHHRRPADAPKVQPPAPRHRRQAVTGGRPLDCPDAADVAEHRRQLSGSEIPDPDRVGHVVVDRREQLPVGAPCKGACSWVGCGSGGFGWWGGWSRKGDRGRCVGSARAAG